MRLFVVKPLTRLTGGYVIKDTHGEWLEVGPGSQQLIAMGVPPFGGHRLVVEHIGAVNGMAQFGSILMIQSDSPVKRGNGSSQRP